MRHFFSTARWFRVSVAQPCKSAGRERSVPFITAATVMGGNVRVGLEDSLYLGKGKFAWNNGEQVAKIRRILEELSLEVASPGEVRAMLGLKGADQVGF
jgi:uncharacterized protein (DUF849 family)